MATFRCNNCGQKILVAEIHAGKKGKCPKCKSIVVVPKTQNASPVTSQPGPPDSKVFDLKPSTFDVPQSNETQKLRAGTDHVSDSLAADMQGLERESGAEEVEPVAKRKFPWLIDIFFYPVSTPGLTIIGIIILIPLLIDFAARLLGPFGILIAVPGFFAKGVIYLYTYWYFCRCIRDSALGGVRAPDVLVDAPDLGDMFR